jgi:hypothetical protein
MLLLWGMYGKITINIHSEIGIARSWDVRMMDVSANSLCSLHLVPAEEATLSADTPSTLLLKAPSSRAAGHL